MTDDRDLDTVLAAYRAFAGGDIAAAVADLDADVVWVEPDSFVNGGRHDGRAAVAAYLQASYAGWRELTSDPRARRAGDRIVVEHHLSGVLADGTPATALAVDVFTLRGGVVVHMQAYADPSDLPDALVER